MNPKEGHTAWPYASQYADLLRKAKASSLLRKECTLLVRIQLSNKNASHTDCAFADCMSTTMRGAMISLTSCIAPAVPRDCDLHESAEFKDATDMIQQLNGYLAKPDVFPAIPIPRKDCHTFYAKPDGGSSKRGQSVPVDPSKRTNPEEKGLPWHDLGEINVDKDYLYPDGTVIPCPVEKVEQLSPEQQPTYIQWILYCFDLDHKVDKDQRIYCSYCDMNNHPRFSCKHAFKRRNPLEKHHCTLCAAKHPPFLCPRAQVNGGPGQPNWYKAEYKRAKQENREADYRWGPMVTHVDVDGPDSTSQHPSEAPQPVNVQQQR